MNSGQTIRLGVLTAVHAPLQVLVVLGLSLLLFALYCCSTRRPSSSNPETTNVNPILALLAPSTSHMPKYYVQKNTHDSFKVDLLALVSNVANGIVELRNSDTSLPTLLDGHHKCTLTFNLRWIFLVIKAIILAPLVSYPGICYLSCLDSCLPSWSCSVFLPHTVHNHARYVTLIGATFDLKIPFAWRCIYDRILLPAILDFGSQSTVLSLCVPLSSSWSAPFVHRCPSRYESSSHHLQIRLNTPR
ncbi:hypothetical protein DL96DRAFT_1604539 [Flagelloscypha sp. PMI_526]|nr:hypothetical protein DL96DRAFT_1604539 [Flagelloscypha sp. PMI_526]